MPISLPNAVVGKVVTRFPPEPSWMLDLGHCKASLMNQYIATQFQGQWILRFDDTNPKTCSRENVAAYMQDMPLLGLTPSRITYASDYFEPMVSTATGLIEAGFLYADDTPTEQMRAQRMAKEASPQRDRTPQDSLAAWAEMQAGSEAGQRFCLRIKLNPASENGALRDPVAWRGIDEPHYKTGTRFRVYPTYDFAAPWLDLAEGVTHALRTLEFRDRDVLYNAVQQAILKLHPEWTASNIWEFPRIHMSYTPQAKVHQKALLAAGLVDGPTDPRLPTLRGLMRAGCHPDALKAFLLEQVSPARKETYHSWDKLWTLNRRLMDPTAARHMAVADEGRVLVTLVDGPDEPVEQEVLWKQGHMVRVVPYKQVWIDQEDAQMLCEGDEVTLLAWGNAIIQSVTQDTPQQQQQQQQCNQQAAAADAAVQAAADQGNLQQQQQQQQQQQAAEADGSTVPLGKSSTAVRQPSPHKGDVSPAADVCQSEATAAAGVAFGGFRDVMALRDELQQAHKVPWGSSSCASTAGSTSVAALGSLLYDAEEAPEGVVQSSHIGLSQQQQFQPPQQQLPTATKSPGCVSGAGQEVPGSSPRVVSISARLNLIGSPKASKLKLHWLPNLPDQLLPLRLVRFGHPVLEEKVTEDVDVVAAFNHNSRVESRAWGDPSLLLSAKRGNVVQLQRKGFFIVDEVLLKDKAASTEEAHAAKAAAAAVADSGPVSSKPVVVPVGAEAAAAAGKAAREALVPCTQQQQEQRQQQQQQQQPVTDQRAVSQLQLGDIQELVLFFIPDGHSKHE